MKILETPRDAMQGLTRFIPTDKKVELINALLQVGFDILDVGSFVSPKVIPQFKDIEVILDKIDISNSESKLFVLVPNVKGGEKAAKHNSISYIGYPFSTSETFLKKNINSDFDSAIDIMNRLQDLCLNSNKTLMLYLAMAFGNPYGDPSDVEIILEWVDKLNQMGVNVISLSDIIGIATPEQISKIYQMLSSEYPNIEFGIHLHIKDNDWYDKIDAAYKNGCKIFDGVISGIGGCPMTGYEMLGNLPTGNILDYAQKNNIPVSINENKFNRAKKLANEILSDLL